MNKVRELKTDNKLWAKPAKLVNLLDFNPEKLTIDKALNSIHNTSDASSKDLTDIYQQLIIQKVILNLMIILMVFLI